MQMIKMMCITLCMIHFDLVKFSTHNISVYTVQYDSHVMMSVYGNAYTVS